MLASEFGLLGKRSLLIVAPKVDSAPLKPTVTLGLTRPLEEKWTENKDVRSCKQGEWSCVQSLLKL